MKTTFTLSGLHCFACTKLIKLKLQGIKGVGSCLVSLNGETEIISEEAIDMGEIMKALKGTSYNFQENPDFSKRGLN